MLDAGFGIRSAQMSHIVHGIDDRPKLSLARRVARIRSAYKPAMKRRSLSDKTCLKRQVPRALDGRAGLRELRESSFVLRIGASVVQRLIVHRALK